MNKTHVSFVRALARGGVAAAVAIGAGTVKSDVTLSAAFSVMAEPTAALTVEGTLALGENAIVHVADVAALKKTKTYTLATATAIILPEPLMTDNPDWSAAVVGNELKIDRVLGTLVIIR